MLTFLHKVELFEADNQLSTISFLQIQLQLHKFEHL